MANATAPATPDVPQGSLADLSTTAPDRAFVTIDKTAYFLALPSDLGVGDQARMKRVLALWERVDAGDPADVTDDEIDRLEANIKWAGNRLLLDCPDDVRGKLRDDQLLAIVQAFGTAAGTVQPTKAPKQTKRKAGTKA